MKVADFGFARKFTNDDLSKTYCGSTAYTAPEVLRARGAYNAMLVSTPYAFFTYFNLNERPNMYIFVHAGTNELNKF